MGAISIRPIAESQAKFASRAAAAAPEYTNGVRAAGPKWAAGVEASQKQWAEGVQESIANGSYGAGARKAGPGKYQDRAVKLGGDRFRTGVAEGAADWGKNTQEVLSVLNGFDAGDKGIRGSAQNYERSRRVGEALRKRKLELRGVNR